MSKPPLRRPKTVKLFNEKVEKYVILTLKDKTKLVVDSDGFNGIITVEDGYRCVLCCVNMKLDSKLKENHKLTLSHSNIIKRYPHKEEFGENLIRQLNKDTCYCTICNAAMPTHMLMLHVAGEKHLEELGRALVRAGTYSSTDDNNNK